MTYKEIDDIAEILKLNTQLGKRLRKALPYSEKRTIGYPAGRTNRKTYFNKRSDDSVFWWVNWVDDKGDTINLWGHGTPREEKTPLNIDVQFNFPAQFNRNQGGAFLRHVETGEIILAHRGIVTLGNGRFPKAPLFAAMASRVCEATTSAGIKEFLLIGELESMTIVEEISNFSSRLRQVLRDHVTADASANDFDEKTPKSRQETAAFGELRDYLAEFSGKRRAYVPKKTQADSHHGLVVEELNQALNGNASIFNSREIDLIAERAKSVLLFEVKTSADTQSVYTAIGQLSAHEPRVAQIFSKKAVIKVLVLPEPPMAKLGEILTKCLNIKAIVYARPEKITFTFVGLDQL